MKQKQGVAFVNGFLKGTLLITLSLLGSFFIFPSVSLAEEELMEVSNTFCEMIQEAVEKKDQKELAEQLSVIKKSEHQKFNSCVFEAAIKLDDQAMILEMIQKGITDEGVRYAVHTSIDENKEYLFTLMQKHFPKITNPIFIERYYKSVFYHDKGYFYPNALLMTLQYGADPNYVPPAYKLSEDFTMHCGPVIFWAPDFKTIKILIEKGADPSLTNCKGKKIWEGFRLSKADRKKVKIYLKNRKK